MKHIFGTLLIVIAVAMLLHASTIAQVGPPVGAGLIDPNVATEKQLLVLPHMNADLTKAIMDARPFMDIVALDEFLKSQSLGDEQRKAFYGKAFIHVDLNNASAQEIQLIPGAGRKMAHEFEEYRPWKNWTQFDKEIGKYVDKAEVARLKQYVFIPLNLNTATQEQFMTIPGVGRKMTHEFEEYRPWKSKAQFEKEIGKYVDDKEVARLWRYMTIEETSAS